MITNTGKSIIGKYLIGQTPAYASYIAVGCGATPQDTLDPTISYASKNRLDFEMFRVPISSRGYINENGTEKIVLTAELPTEERYEISEVGIFSAGTNINVGAYDSKAVISFSTTENWQYHTATDTSSIPTITSALDSPLDDNVIAVEEPVFQTNSENAIFYKSSRLARYERPRFLNNSLFMIGNDAALSRTATISTVSGNGTTVTYTTTLPHTLSVGDVVTITGVNPSAYNLSSVTVASVPSTTTFTIANAATGSYVSGGSLTVPHFVIGTSSNHIHLAGETFDFTKNAPTDELRLAFSLVSVNGNSSSVPDKIRILVDFCNADDFSGQYARFEAELIHNAGTAPGANEYDFTANRYFVVTKQLQDLYTSPNFSWNLVNLVKIYVTTEVSNVPSENYYIAFDGMRLENVDMTNPLYGLVGYTVVKNDGAVTIIKSPNTNNYIEFRFTVGVS